MKIFNYFLLLFIFLVFSVAKLKAQCITGNNNQIVWTDLVGVSIDAENRLIKQINNNFWDAGAASRNALEPGENGWIEFTVESSTDAYMIGLSQYNNNAASSIGFALYINGGTLYIFENSVNKGTFGTVAVGDNFEIEKVCDELRYKKNESTLRTVALSPSLPLLADISILRGKIPPVTSSFCIPLLVSTTVNNHSCVQSEDGSINLSLSGVAPFHVQWADGSNEVYRTGLPIGTYDVFISDSKVSKSYKYRVGQKVIWSDFVNSTETEGGVSKLVAGNLWNAGAVSKNGLEPGEDGWIEIIIDKLTSDVYTIGLTQLNPDAGNSSINYALHYNAGVLMIYENGVNLGNFGGLSVGDVLQIERIDGEIRYVKNNSVLRTKAVSNTQPLLIDMSIYRGKATHVSSSFCVPLLVSAEVNSLRCDDVNYNSGSINLSVSGNGPFQYLWEDGDTSPARSNLTEGAYEVTVTDSKNLSKIQTFHIGRKVEWTNFVGTTVDNYKLTRIPPNGNWIAGATSKNGLKPGEDGWIEWTIDKLTNHAYMVGLTYINAGVNYTDINYAIAYQNGGIAIYESATPLGSFGAVSLGDILRIERVGEEIRYLKNGELLRARAANSKQSLMVDASIAVGQIHSITSSFCIPLSVSAAITSSPCDASESSLIELKIKGLEPYSVLWSDGDTAKIKYNLPPGDYTVTVRDAKQNLKTVVYSVGKEVQWTDLERLVINGSNRLVKPEYSPAYNAGAASSNGLESGEDGWISFVMEELSTDVFLVGLSVLNTNTDYRTVNFCFYYTNGNMNIYENGYGVSIGPAQRGDVYKIERKANELLYLKNNIVMKSRPIDPLLSLIVDVSNYRGTIPYVSTSFCIPLKVTADVRSGTCSNLSNGSILLRTSGNSPVSYLWNDGATTNERKNLSPGEYSVIVKDSKNIVKSYSYNIGNQVTWKDLMGVSVDGSNRLFKMGTTNSWDAGAASDEVLSSGKDGWIEFVIDNPYNYSYFIGLSVINRDVTFQSQKYSFYYSRGSMYIYEGTSSLGNFGAISKGDVFRIERIGNEIRYIRNGSILRSKTVINTESLLVDVAILNGVLPSISTSFCLPNRPNLSSAVFRSKASGVWNDFNIWEISEGEVFMTALQGETPSQDNPVYIQGKHTVSLPLSSSCKDLNLNSDADVIRLNTEENVLDVYGKLRLYTGTYPGTISENEIIEGFITTGTNGRIRLKGTTNRIITEKGEFSDHENLKGWTLECDLAEGVIGTINSNFRAGNVIITSGNLEVKSKNFKVSK